MRIAILSAVALFAMAASAAAQPMGPVSDQARAAHAAARQACAAEIGRFCTAGGHMGQCLKAHKTELSPGCRSALMAAHQAHAATPMPQG